MRVVVSADTCEATGFCQEVAGTVFRVSDAGYSVVLVDDVPAELTEDVEEAVHLCPTRSIEIVEE